MFKKLYEYNTPYKPSNKSIQNTYTDRLSTRKNIMNTYTQYHKTKRSYMPGNYQLLQCQSYLYQGQLNKSMKQGQGILMTKKGQIIIGQWNKDVLHGSIIFVTPFGGLIYANYYNGKLNGWCIANYANKVVICTQYFQDKIDGERLIYQESEKLWVASKYTKQGKLIQITHVQKGQINTLPSFFIEEKLQQYLQAALSYNLNYYKFKKIKSVWINTEMCYFGYLDAQNMPKGLGVIFSKKQIYFGNFNTGILEGYGRIIFQNGDIFHGNLKGGLFEHIGIFYNCQDNVTLVSKFNDGEFNQILAQQKGYVCIDIDPQIGKHFDLSLQIGLKGQSIYDLFTHIEKYYNCYHIPQNQLKQGASKFSNMSNYENSEISIKDKSSPKVKQSSDKKNNSSKKQNGEKWLGQFGQSSDDEQSIKKSYSLRKDDRNNKNKFQSINVQQNNTMTEKEFFNKKLPNLSKLNSKNKFLSPKALISNTLDMGLMTFRKSSAENQDREFLELNLTQVQNQKQQSKQNHVKQQVSDLSNISGDIQNLLRRAKLTKKKKRIFL